MLAGGRLQSAQDARQQAPQPRACIRQPLQCERRRRAQAHSALGAKQALPGLQPEAVAIAAEAGISRPLDAPSQARAAEPGRRARPQVAEAL